MLVIVGDTGVNLGGCLSCEESGSDSCLQSQPSNPGDLERMVSPGTPVTHFQHSGRKLWLEDPYVLLRGERIKAHKHY